MNGLKSNCRKVHLSKINISSSRKAQRILVIQKLLWLHPLDLVTILYLLTQMTKMRFASE